MTWYKKARRSQTIGATGTSRSAGKPVRSLVDLSWQSSSKITLDLSWPWAAERVREREREEEETGGRRGRPRPATMTSRVSNRARQEGSERRR